MAMVGNEEPCSVELWTVSRANVKERQMMPATALVQDNDNRRSA